MKCENYRTCQVYITLMAHLEAEEKRWKNKIKYIDDPPEQWSRREKFDYYMDKLEESKKRHEMIKKFLEDGNE